MIDRDAAHHPHHCIGAGRKGVVDLRQSLQIPVGVARVVCPAAEHFVRNDDEVFTLRGQFVQTVQNGRSGGFARPGGVVKFVGGQVAEVFQQGGAPREQVHRAQMQGALQCLELLFRPHPAVLFHPCGALGVPYLHRGKVIARERGLQHKAFGVRAFSAGCATDHQRQHWGVYGGMPPSVKE